MTELEMLRDENAQLKEALGINIALPNDMGLTPIEGRIVGMLVKRDIANRDMLYAALYSDRLPNHQPDPKTIDVHICKLRRKLLPKGIRIFSRYGVGYYMDKEVRRSLKDRVAELVAA